MHVQYSSRLSVILLLLMSVAFPENAPAEIAKTHVIKMLHSEGGTNFSLDGNLVGTADDIYEIVKTKALISKADIVEIHFGAKVDLIWNYSPPYDQSGLIPLLLKAGASIKYFDSTGSVLKYRLLTWTGYRHWKEDPAMAEFTLDGKNIGRESIYDVLKIGDIEKGSCLQIVCPWEVRSDAPRPKLPFDWGKIDELAKKNFIRVEFVYEGE